MYILKSISTKLHLVCVFFLFCRQLVVLIVGASCLQLFVQNNWVGPFSEKPPHTFLSKQFKENEQVSNSSFYFAKKNKKEKIHVYLPFRLLFPINIRQGRK